MSPRFTDRSEAAHLLAERLRLLLLPPPLVVLALPRGGVPIGAIVARALGAPLDLLMVRKIGMPWQPELALAAVVDGDPPELVVDEALRRGAGVHPDYIAFQQTKELHELARRRAAYLHGRQPVPLAGCSVIVVDDGIATGTTMRAALQAVRRRAPQRLVLAVPVAPSDTLAALHAEVDQIVCLAQPTPFEAVGLHYRDFHQVSDEEVVAALDSVAVPAPHENGTRRP
ncbi:MAG: phosphoribosyltransferase [Burkholderiales bacterium]|nr:phosphoribosyltransferase [Burkholderiales bacterium]